MEHSYTGADERKVVVWAAKTLGRHFANYAFFPQYRLAGGKGKGEREKGYFPAALQDAVTAYTWLIDAVGFEASNILISGDRAGGNIAMGLVRWIGEAGFPSAEARSAGLGVPTGCTL